MFYQGDRLHIVIPIFLDLAVYIISLSLSCIALLVLYHFNVPSIFSIV